MSKKNINVILIIIIIAAAIFFVSKQSPFVRNVKIRVISAPILPKTPPAEQQLYDINKIKPARQEEPKKEAVDLESAYKNYPKETAGSNMIEKWKKVDPETKVKLMNGFTDTIEKAREDLKINPNDENAKSRLVISEMLKTLALNNFNCKFKEKNSGGK